MSLDEPIICPMCGGPPKEQEPFGRHWWCRCRNFRKLINPEEDDECSQETNAG